MSRVSVVVIVLMYVSGRPCCRVVAVYVSRRRVVVVCIIRRRVRPSCTLVMLCMSVVVVYVRRRRRRVRLPSCSLAALYVSRDVPRICMW